MIVSVTNSRTGETRTLEATSDQIAQLEALCSSRPPSRQELEDRLDSLGARSPDGRVALSGDQKALLFSLNDWVINIGRRTLHIGRKLLDLLIKLAVRYPNTSVALLVGLLVSYVFSHIPVIGDALGAALLAILALMGFVADWRQMAHQHPIEAKQVEVELKSVFA